MSWRFLLICAVVITVLYGAGTVVASSGSPERTPRSGPRPTADAETVRRELGSVDGTEANWTPRPMTSAERAACPPPTEAPANGRYLCAFTSP